MTGNRGEHTGTQLPPVPAHRKPRGPASATRTAGGRSEVQAGTTAYPPISTAARLRRSAAAEANARAGRRRHTEVQTPEPAPFGDSA